MWAVAANRERLLVVVLCTTGLAACGDGGGKPSSSEGVATSEAAGGAQAATGGGSAQGSGTQETGDTGAGNGGSAGNEVSESEGPSGAQPGATDGTSGDLDAGSVSELNTGGGGSTQPDAGDGIAATSDRSACKRGVAYGHHSVADLHALSSGVSWWYNWDFRPDEALRDGAYRDEDVEFVPMIWGAGSDRDAALGAIGADATALLGFNEPNFGGQANLSPADAAKLWPELEMIADELGLRLVSPAVNFCGGDCQDTDPFHYLDDFFAACTGCRVDAVAIHIYVGCSPSGDNKAEWLINHVETYKSRFELPLWLTEFACDSAQNMAEQKAFMQDAVAYLEADERIERYAWFAGRADNVPYVDLLGADGELTDLGEAYVSAPQGPECVR